MKPNIEDKATITVQEALNHYCLSPRKFYATLHLPGLSFVVFYYDGRRLIIREEFEKYLAEHAKHHSSCMPSYILFESSESRDEP